MFSFADKSNFDEYTALGFTYEQYIQLMEKRKREGFPFMFLSGPNIIHVFTIEDQTFYLFGEIHDRIPNCPDSIKYPEYVEFVLKRQPDKLIDIFHEFPYDLSTIENEKLRSDYFSSDKTLFTLASKFENCFKADKSKCKYNARFHYADIRFLPAVAFLREAWFSLQESDDKFEGAWLMIKKMIPKFKTESGKYDKHGIYWLEKSKAWKQFKAIKSSNIREKVVDYWVEEIDNATLYLYENYESKYKVKDAIYELHVLLVDAYTIGRMLRSYENGPKARNIMAYFGQDHIFNLVSCFNYIFDIGEYPDYEEQGLEGCIFINNEELVPPLFK